MDEFNRGHELAFDSIMEEVAARPWGMRAEEAFEILLKNRLDRFIISEKDMPILRQHFKEVWHI